MKVYTMKKYLIALAASMLLSTSVFAGSFGVGVSGTLFNIDADVTETTSSSDTNSGSNTNTGSVSHGGVAAGSIFAEYTFDAYPVTFGIDVIPGTADISKNVQKRTETPAVPQSNPFLRHKFFFFGDLNMQHNQMVKERIQYPK